MDALDVPQLQRLFVELLGDPVCAKIAKETSTALKGVTKDSLPPPGYGRSARRQTPYPGRRRGPQCFNVMNGVMSPVLAAVLQSSVSLVGVVPEILSCRSFL